MWIASCHTVVLKRRIKGERRKREGREKKRRVIGGLRRIPYPVGSDGSGVLIRTRVLRYEIIKLGLDDSEGNSATRRGG